MHARVEQAVLSTVIIARNQASHIGRLVQSVLDEPLAEEILLVDSASTDGTVDLAKEFAIEVVQLLETESLSPSAGRRVGFERTSGAFVLFLDGDMQLLPGWTARAVDLLSSQGDVAAVTGKVVNVFDDEPPQSISEEGYGEVTELRCRQTGGMAMYRRAALEQVGGFHPYLQSDEEPELCLRIRRAGFRLLKVDLPAALHFTRAPTLRSLFERRRRRLYLGQGQIIRLLLGDRLLLEYLRERGYALAPAAVLAAGLFAASISLGRRDARPILIWLGGVASVVVLFGVRRKTLPGTAYSLLHRLFIFEGTVRGFIRGPGDVRNFAPPLRTIS
jgi:glycosyltransferase involved in cell wall biosynthesis